MKHTFSNKCVCLYVCVCMYDVLYVQCVSGDMCLCVINLHYFPRFQMSQEEPTHVLDYTYTRFHVKIHRFLNITYTRFHLIIAHMFFCTQHHVFKTHVFTIRAFTRFQNIHFTQITCFCCTHICKTHVFT